jgi:hypothetical protein
VSVRPRSAIVLAVLAALAVPTTAPAHFDSSGPSPEAAAKRKGAQKKCRRGQVRYVIGKRRTCRPLRKALPRPKRGDPRLIFARAAIPGKLKGLRDRRGRRPPSIEKAIRRISPRALRVFEGRALPKAIQMLDQLAARRAAAQAAGTRPARPSQSDISASFDLGNGVTIDLRAKLAGQATVEVAITGRREGALVRTRIGTNLDLGFRAAECPTADGVLDATDGLRVSITTELLDDDRSVDYYYTNVVSQDTKLHGEVGDDAKLKTLEVTDKLQIGEYTGGSIFGGTRIESVAKRHTVVDMKTGRYDPGRSNVQVSVAMSGILRIFQSSALAGATQRLQKAADEGFAATVKRAMEKYRERESAWQTPNRCAEAKFDPRSGTLIRDIGQRGSFRAETTSKRDGGRPPRATWTASQQEGGALTPPSAGANPASISYIVGGGPRIRGVLKAVSRAGVAEAPWQQPIRNFSLHRIAGNFSGTFTQPVGPRTAQVSWTGSGTFVRTTPGFPGAVGSYVLKAGSATFHFSGGNILGHAVCDMKGSEFVDLFQDGGGSIGVNPGDPLKPFAPGPHSYSGDVALGPEPMVTLTMENCIPEAASEEGKTYTIPIGYPPLDTGPDPRQSPDGIQYNGSHSESQGGITTQWSWTLAGSAN